MIRRRFVVMAGVVSAWIAVLSAALWLGWSPGAARATAQGTQAAASRLADRTWENYFGVTILPSGRAFVVGDKGILMSSEDKGQTWSRRQLRKGSSLFDLYSVAFAPDGNHGWVVGDGGAIFHSDDGGTTWNLQENKVPAALLKVAVVDSQKACAVGEHGTVLCTSDGGATWNLQKFEDLVFFDVAFTDPQNGWVVGEFATALHTVDGGKTWSVAVGGQRSISADPYFAIGFDAPTNGVAVGLNGADMVTTDGGKSWKPGKLAGENHSIFSVITRPGSSSAEGLYVGGADGALGSLEQGKVIVAKSPNSNSITDVALTPGYGLAVGLAGTILRSEDVGQHWNSVTSGDVAQTQAQ